MTPRNKVILLSLVVVAGCAIVAVTVFRSQFVARQSGQTSPESVEATTDSTVPTSPPANESALVSGKPNVVSISQLIALIKKLSADGASSNELFRQITAMRLPEQSWWRTGEEVGALLNLVSDHNLGEDYRVVAMSVYLGGASQGQISENATVIQKLALGGGDKMACAVLQGMADRSVAPSDLTKETLESENRGTGAKCYAWYAARLTEKNDPDLAGIAIAATESGQTEASKVAFDYLASGSYGKRYTADSNFQQKTDALLKKVELLPSDAGPLDLANGDALIRAVPSITPTDTAINSLLSLLQEAQNPEMRLSALEQLVSIQLSGARDLSQELHEVRDQIATLFSDPVKQNRAKLRLNRIQAQRKSK